MEGEAKPTCALQLRISRTAGLLSGSNKGRPFQLTVLPQRVGRKNPQTIGSGLFHARARLESEQSSKTRDPQNASALDPNQRQATPQRPEVGTCWNPNLFLHLFATLKHLRPQPKAKTSDVKHEKLSQTTQWPPLPRGRLSAPGRGSRRFVPRFVRGRPWRKFETSAPFCHDSCQNARAHDPSAQPS